MNTKWERRETKKQKGWYKKHLANNRKALEVIREAKRNRLKNAMTFEAELMLTSAPSVVVEY